MISKSFNFSYQSSFSPSYLRNFEQTNDLRKIIEAKIVKKLALVNILDCTHKAERKNIWYESTIYKTSDSFMSWRLLQMFFRKDCLYAKDTELSSAHMSSRSLKSCPIKFIWEEYIRIAKISKAPYNIVPNAANNPNTAMTTFVTPNPKFVRLWNRRTCYFFQMVACKITFTYWRGGIDQ